MLGKEQISSVAQHLHLRSQHLRSSRVAPDELSFGDHAWKDLYPRPKSLRGAQLRKHVPFTPRPEVLFVGQLDEGQHAKLRKASAPAFSSSEIRAGEDTLQEHSSRLIRKPREESGDKILHGLQ
ncbi:hypothetical protein BJ875DRAFT_180638 [Amylocarpus encephaloides]|uniref:Uncharacterized protein n=1 Tax=Amylocarpus encephaloides TaxID=45428 RepID=A0A9P7Y9W2_9HELO|nr:hypothetical protein BJ875DRAFT_180638 [Amylocarpus encephaloides]